MRTAAAQLPEPPYGADRIIVTRNAVAVLDGASAFEPASVPPGEYASHLGAFIGAALTETRRHRWPACRRYVIAPGVAGNRVQQSEDRAWCGHKAGKMKPDPNSGEWIGYSGGSADE